MRKILSIVIALTVSLSAFAQSTFSVGVGATMHNYFTKVGEESLRGTSNGLFLEVMGSFPVAEQIDITGGLKGTLTGLGKKGVNLLQYRGRIFVGTVESEKMTFLELPVNVKFNFGPRMRSHFFVMAGPALSFWLSYREKYEDSLTKINADVFKEMDGFLNRFNVGAGGSLGIESASFRLSLGYDYYFLNLFTDNLLSAKSHRGQARVGVAYLF